MSPRKVANWGLYPEVEANILEPANSEAVRNAIASNDHMIARGNGRCYGDASLSETILSTLKLNRFLSFDEINGIIECESGVLLSEVLDVIVPKGFFLPVTPGTKYITVGGAIAADIHGKNHHAEGSFSQHVIELVLMNEFGECVISSPEQNDELFWKTCGGMGLTGIIVSAKFRLKPIETAYIKQLSQKAKDIDGVMRLFEDSRDATYSVAWIDCFAAGKSFGRSILISGEHALLRDLPFRLQSDPLQRSRKSKLNVPIFLPTFFLNYASVRAFNFLYYNRHVTARKESIVHFDPFFYPLDSVSNWNRAYGKAGFLQYQFVLPTEKSHDGLIKIVEKIQQSHLGSPLAVLKLLGKAHPRAVMSFPIEGYTLALDFKANDRSFHLLNVLDEIVLECGGKIYLAKDARMSARIFDRCYERKISANKFRSLQSERLGL